MGGEVWCLGLGFGIWAFKLFHNGSFKKKVKKSMVLQSPGLGLTVKNLRLEACCFGVWDLGALMGADDLDGPSSLE